MKKIFDVSNGHCPLLLRHEINSMYIKSYDKKYLQIALSYMKEFILIRRESRLTRESWFTY